MGNSLREQMLKAGLVSEAQVRDAKAKKKTRQARKSKQSASAPIETDSAARQATRRQADKVARDRELNRKKETRRAQAALQAQVRELIGRHRVNDPNGDIAHHFVDGKRIKRVYVTQEQN